MLFCSLKITTAETGFHMEMYYSAQFRLYNPTIIVAQHGKKHPTKEMSSDGKARPKGKEISKTT